MSFGLVLEGFSSVFGYLYFLRVFGKEFSIIYQDFKNPPSIFNYVSFFFWGGGVYLMLNIDGSDVNFLLQCGPTIES